MVKIFFKTKFKEKWIFSILLKYMRKKEGGENLLGGGFLFFRK
jgi:hypothetical protein